MHHIRTEPTPALDFAAWIAKDPVAASIAIDRELVRQGGLRAFIKLAWHTVEGSTPYSSNWHIDAICDHLEAVSSSEIKRCMIAVPPRSMKPVWEGETVVIKGRGSVKLASVKLGDLILTHRRRFRRVLAVHDNGILPTLQICTRGGRTARMAYDHPVLTAAGFRPCAKVGPGTLVVVATAPRLFGLNTGDTRFDEVATLEPAQPARCICLTVEEDETFTAGGIVVHNSVSTAVMWPAWDWIDHPERRSLFSSYAHNLSKRDSARCRRVIQSPWFQARWGNRFRLTGDQNAKWRFENDRTGYRLATSVNGQLTGEGGDFVIVDDPLNSKDANSALKRENMLTWWSESMSTRLNDPANGAFVIIQQRLHMDDLIGDILRKQGVVEDGGDYTYLCLPAMFEPDHPNRWFRDPRKEMGELLWPEHVPQKVVDTLMCALGPYAGNGQLQQRPAPREGGLFKRSWFPLVSVLPPDLEYSRGWDMAATEKQILKTDPDWTATVLFGWSRSMRRWYIVDIQRWRESPAMIERLVKQVSQEDRDLGRDVKIVLPQDPGAAGKAMAQSYLHMLSGFDVMLEPQSGDKGHRATPLASQASGGNVSMLKSDKWNEDFLQEITGFPTASHDDMVDAAASAFTRLTGGTTGLLEFYARQMDDLTRAKAEAAMELAKHGGVLPGLVVREEETQDLARALLPSATRGPVLS